MAIVTMIKVPVSKGARPKDGGSNKGAHVNPKNWVPISESKSTVAGTKETTIPAVIKIVTIVAIRMTETAAFWKKSRRRRSLEGASEILASL
jgi:hypothetical protein